MEKRDIIVVSLFDGLSGGRVALDRVEHLNVLRYYSSEIDEYAIKIANKNYPQDEPYRLGSVIDMDVQSVIDDIYNSFGSKIPILLIGGSPCQGFSLAGKLKGATTECGIDVTSLEQYLKLKEEDFQFNGQSYLFWEFKRIMEELQPDYFMLENVRVTKKWLPMFNEAVGVEPIFVNSEIVSAQNRPRYYWQNFSVGSIIGTNTTIADIIDLSYVPIPRFTVSDYTIDKTVKPGVATNIQTQHGIVISSDKPFQQLKCTSGFQDNKIGLTKLPCLRAGNNATYLLHKKVYRRMTPLEAERSQTLPDNYTLVMSEGKQLVSDTQRFKMIGNGWTIDVPAHIFRSIK